MPITKEALADLLDKLSDKQVEYIYHLAELLFCKDAD